MQKCNPIYFIIVIAIFVFHLNIDAKEFIINKNSITSNSNPIERFWILYNLHNYAIKTNSTIRYLNIDSLTIEIPEDAKSIPLNNGCDFHNLHLTVINKKKDFELFSLKSNTTPITLTCTQIDHSDFTDITSFNTGKKLLIIEDQSAWAKERIGYGYPHYRKDILLINNGISKDRPIQPYSDNYSHPKCQYINVSSMSVKIRDIEIIRSDDSSYKTICFSLDNQYKINLSNISIITPESELFGDEAIRIRNSYDISLSKIKINGTYSQKNKFGYGIGMDNVNHVIFSELKTESKWGIFGNNNCQKIIIDKSEINRFDIHCYGKDVLIKNTLFKNYRNQFGSFYGKIEFHNCTFQDFTPISIRDSYMLNTKFDIYMFNCRLEWNKQNIEIISVGESISNKNNRDYQQAVEWPNLFMKNNILISHLPNNNSSLCIYVTTNKDKINLNKKPFYNIKDLRLYGFNKVTICNTLLDFDNSSNFNIISYQLMK